MGHHYKLRAEKNCLNCGSIVEERFCPHCGQENIETRQPFHYLIGHFMEDLTHYDGQFWSTMKDLLFKPGQLTKTYLSGKRLQYVNPVKLYIFISFIAFFLPALIPDFSHKSHKKEETEVSKKKKEKDPNAKLVAMKALRDKNLISEEEYQDYVTDMNETRQKDSLAKLHPRKQIPEEYNYLNQSFLHGATTQEEYDSIQAKLPPAKRNNFWLNKAASRMFYWTEEKITFKELTEKWKESFVHNFPKVIFVYMPLFAFILWLFENKKKFWYFDASIFTLHFFSFLLSACTIIIVLFKLTIGFESGGLWKLFWAIISIATAVYTIIYFFKSHRRVFYQSRKRVLLKGIFIFFINMLFMIVFIIAYTFIIGYRIH